MNNFQQIKVHKQKIEIYHQFFNKKDQKIKNQKQEKDQQMLLKLVMEIKNKIHKYLKMAIYDFILIFNI